MFDGSSAESAAAIATPPAGTESAPTAQTFALAVQVKARAGDQDHGDDGFHRGSFIGSLTSETVVRRRRHYPVQRRHGLRNGQVGQFIGDGDGKK